MTRIETNNHPPTPTANLPSLGDRVRSLRLGAPAPSATRGPWSTVIPWGITGILLLTTLALGYRSYRITPTALASSNGSPRNEKPASAPEINASPSSVSDSAVGDVVLQSKGYVIPSHSVQVSPKVGGMLIWLDPDLEEGKQFQEGQLLAILEDVDYLADRDMALANLKNLEAQLARLHQAPPQRGDSSQRGQDARGRGQCDRSARPAHARRTALHAARGQRRRTGPSAAGAQGGRATIRHAQSRVRSPHGRFVEARRPGSGSPGHQGSRRPGQGPVAAGQHLRLCSRHWNHPEQEGGKGQPGQSLGFFQRRLGQPVRHG